jgi:response regulator of citrate/malate metabolism
MGKACRRAVELGSVPVTQDDRGVLHIQPAAGDAASTRAAFRRDRRNTVTRERLEKAAAAYKKISDDPDQRDTFKAVGDEIDVSRATAHRYVTRARELGLLEEEQ